LIGMNNKMRFGNKSITIMRLHTVLTILFLSLINFAVAQNVGIGTTTPAEKLEVKNPLRSTVRISSDNYIDTTQLLLRNRNSNNEGTDFSIKSIREQGLIISSLSDLPQNNSDNSLVILPNGRVGVKTPTPGYAFDVNGDMNTNAALRVNGNAGTNGQVLRSNGNGTMAWDDMCEYKNFVTLQSTVPDFWTVPAGVTRILIEGWGAGGGGSLFAGGGGGGYVRAYFTVAPGDMVTYQTGNNGTGSSTAHGVTGSVTAFTVGAVNITASGGQGALYLTTVNGQAGVGGGFSVGSFKNYVAMQGMSGQSQERIYYQYNATTYYENGKAGHGGDAANSNNTGGLGQTYLYNTTGAALVFRNGNTANGKLPGGGGASGVQYGASIISGGDGADGVLIIRY
jgi:hypothetical protein